MQNWLICLPRVQLHPDNKATAWILALAEGAGLASPGMLEKGRFKSLSSSQLFTALLLDLYARLASVLFTHKHHSRTKLLRRLRNLSFAMRHVLKAWSKSPSQGQLTLLQDCRTYSSRPTSDSEAADLDAAREWFRRFNKSTIPEKIAKTEFSRSSGAGGQAVNKYVEKSCAVNILLTFIKD
jgi:hypothetical protein